MQNIVLVGSSGHAKVVIDVVEKQGCYRIAGLIDAFRTPGEETLGYRVLGGEADLPGLAAEHDLKGLIVAIGDNYVRAKVAAKVADVCPQLPFVSALHPAASVGKGTRIGAGTVVMAGAVINADCRVGQFCIVNTKASLDHDCVMDDFSSLAPGVTTGGNCRVGSHAAVSIGAVLRHGITIGEHSVVGAGSIVLKAVDAFSVTYGNPAKRIRDRQKGDKYL
ncbi:Putative acetyltransferase EpsM [Paraburkholderia sediminicola]|uniref:Acetyltransferase EpsM n=1 Tax=Paraburkholderia sediminicola TaxID=458836 RepID=A0A6J5CJF4_9BURK|nr:acetyltransferase [Paraburkholderia sediminicola]CAB3738815.1 Putative acetyltransferase EpsM [Paraburkholderia sediminicola]